MIDGIFINPEANAQTRLTTLVQAAESRADLDSPVSSSSSSSSSSTSIQANATKYFTADTNEELDDVNSGNYTNGAGDFYVDGDWFGGVQYKRGKNCQEDRILVELFSDQDQALLEQLTEDQLKDAIKKTFAELNDEILKDDSLNNKGSTGIITLFIPHSRRTICVNIGDSRLITVKFYPNGGYTYNRVNALHNTNEQPEVMRVRKKGRSLTRGRIGGVLGVTRALGDKTWRDCGLDSEPDVYVKTADLEDEEIHICACDGLDPLELFHIADFVSANRHLSDYEISLGLARLAFMKGSIDNFSALITRFKAGVQKGNMRLFGVFDGHGALDKNFEVASYLQTHFITCFMQHVKALVPAPLEAVVQKLETLSMASAASDDDSVGVEQKTHLVQFKNEPVAQPIENPEIEALRTAYGF